MKTSNYNKDYRDERAVLEALEPSVTEWEEFFLKNLKEMYWAERELSEYMHELIALATSAELIDALNGHFQILSSRQAGWKTSFI